MIYFVNHPKNKKKGKEREAKARPSMIERFPNIYGQNAKKCLNFYIFYKKKYPYF